MVGEEQILVCPVCQQEHPDWQREARACRRCGSTRLQIQLGMIVCRSCGENWEIHPSEATF